MGKNSNYAYGEADFLAGYPSERLSIGSEMCMADFLSLSVKNEHERKKKKSKSNGIKSDPHGIRPKTKTLKFAHVYTCPSRGLPSGGFPSFLSR